MAETGQDHDEDLAGFPINIAERIRVAPGVRLITHEVAPPVGLTGVVDAEAEFWPEGTDPGRAEVAVWLIHVV